MSSKYTPILHDIATRELPSLEIDVQNASTPASQQACMTRMFKIVRYLVHDAVLGAQGAPPARPAAPPAPPPPIVQRRVPTSASSPLPPLPAIDSPSQPPVNLVPTIVPADVPVQAGVTNVTITSQGTHVVSPGGQQSVIPPRQPVPIEATSDAPPELPPASEGTEQVILPRGGGLTPELEAALAARSHEEPPK